MRLVELSSVPVDMARGTICFQRLRVSFIALAPSYLHVITIRNVYSKHNSLVLMELQQ